MRTRAIRIAAGLLLALAAASRAEDAPAAPDGFTWKRIESVKASFLMPDGWYFREEEKNGTRAFFITREKIEEGGEFETGLTVNVQRLKKDPAPDKAAQALALMIEGHELLEGWKRGEGALESFGARIRIREKGQPPLVEQIVTIGNRKTNTLYILFFESPEATWPEAWKKGELMLREFLLDDEV